MRMYIRRRCFWILLDFVYVSFRYGHNVFLLHHSLRAVLHVKHQLKALSVSRRIFDNSHISGSLEVMD